MMYNTYMYIYIVLYILCMFLYYIHIHVCICMFGLKVTAEDRASLFKIMSSTIPYHHQ